ncbi:sulfurtransferase [Sphingomonas sp. HDW15A]|uniref:sulfurtransferase n=1 Tax=Sphingomonas sp. HDW15A TaxID=2714942 RepID=UPI00140CC2C3|nr:sulfurtransferase [Sphingomonas sp. HDW15A]QIK96637.1 sulfurtransferase [Sphingomonas sp. HDW15A]
MDELVSTEWLAQNLEQPDLVIVDCTFHMPADGRDAEAEFREGHILGACFLDIDEVADKSRGVPHMLPSPEAFGAAMEAIGVGRDDRIVVYDNSPYRTAARGWFMLRHFGADRVAILDGGLQKWRREGRPLESGESSPRNARFKAMAASDVVAMADLLKGAELPLVDARGRGRFEGVDPDPRPGVEPGHIPGSRNLPFASLYREDGTLKSEEALAQEFGAAGVDPAQPFIATCGSGVTANSVIFAARRLGGRGHKLYDGSWSEWGADPKTPKAKGPA